MENTAGVDQQSTLSVPSYVNQFKEELADYEFEKDIRKRKLKRCQLIMDGMILTLFILSLIMTIIISYQSGYLSTSVPAHIKEVRDLTIETLEKLKDVELKIDSLAELILMTIKPELKIYTDDVTETF